VPDDHVPGRLAEIRERHQRGDPGNVSASFGRVQDIPVLVAVVEAVLAIHVRQAQPVTSHELCERHGALSRLRGLKNDWKRAQIDACGDCVKDFYYVCKHCSCPDDKWPCPTYQAISAGFCGEADGES
jgi:hypothetical protein